jgi:hypothetical protein
LIVGGRRSGPDTLTRVMAGTCRGPHLLVDTSVHVDVDDLDGVGPVTEPIPGRTSGCTSRFREPWVIGPVDARQRGPVRILGALFYPLGEQTPTQGPGAPIRLLRPCQCSRAGPHAHRSDHDASTAPGCPRPSRTKMHSEICGTGPSEGRA